MFRLMRGFKKLEHAEMFLHGDIYMNSLDYYWWHGTPQQKDVLEGVTSSFSTEAWKEMPLSFRESQLYEAQVAPAGIGYCNVCCMSMQKAITLNGERAIEISPEIIDEYSYAVVIDDCLAFIERLFAATSLLGYSFVAGPVLYQNLLLGNPGRKIGHHIVVASNPIEPDMLPEKARIAQFDPFVKHATYRNQSEWRIALCRHEQKGGRYVLNVGDLRKIAHLIRIDEVDQEARAYGKLRSCWMEESFFGNTTREQLVDEFAQLGNGKIRVICTLGSFTG